MKSLKILLYTLRHYKTSTFLNIIGLAIAFTTSYLLLTQVVSEFGYNKGIKDSERIFKIKIGELFKHFDRISAPLAKMMIEDTPFVEAFQFGEIQAYGNDYTFEKFSQSPVVINNARYMAEALDLAGFRIIAGDTVSWKKGQTLGISRSVAEKYGLDIDDRYTSGKTFYSSDSKTIGFIFEDFPENSDFSSLESVICEPYDRLNTGNWNNYNDPLYLKLRHKDDVEAFQDAFYIKYQDLLKEKKEESDIINKDFVELISLNDTYYSQSTMTDIKLGNKSITMVYMIIAIIVLCIAFINFLNFFLALVPQRIKSLNTKKIHGATNLELRSLVFMESLLIMLISLSFTLIFISIIKISPVNDLFDFSIGIPSNINMFIIFIIGILTAGILIAVYPAYYITSFPAAFIVKSNFGATSSGQMLRNTLICLQCFISLFFIICAILVFTQNSFMLKYDMGYESESIMSVNVTQEIGEDTQSRVSFAEKLKENPAIEDVTFCFRNFVANMFMSWGRENKEGESMNFRCFPVAYNFLDVFGIDITDGRDFNLSDEKSDNGIFIFNETARKKWNLTTEDNIHGHKKTTDIAGFSKDFNFQSLQYSIQPFAFYVFGKDYWYGFENSYIKINPNSDIPEVVNFIKEKIIETDPSVSINDIEVRSFRKELAGLYEKEKRQSSIITLFSVISILISLMGVFGLVLFETQYRRSEIAIRRVNGATIGSVLSIFNVRFLKIISLCFAVAAPLASYAFIKWQEQFVYKVGLSSWVFITSVLLVSLITMIVIVASAWRVVIQDPAYILKKE